MTTKKDRRTFKALSPEARNRNGVSAESTDKPWGIDVSHHQGSIDWEKVAATGCAFAYLKATEGATYKDSTYKRNRARAQANGIITGAYHFFRTSASVESQLDNFAAALGTVAVGQLPPVIDVEVPSQWTRLSVARRNELVYDFIEGIRSRLGRHINPIVYLSSSFADDVLKNDPGLKDHPLWLAHYTTKAKPRVPAPWKVWTFWQWTERGRVDGISTYCDVNRFNGSRERLSTLLVKEDIIQLGVNNQ
ncbi:MAG: glycoside hydrolase family 25 protein [Cyanobacteria bacterium HKST-UBA02]|nr:glycoside hydrolase family 25 protein [Cyanobacteria bacterium HKST-UBA02]